MFELTEEEFKNWRSHFLTSKSDKMGLRHRPMAFTEQGAAILSSAFNRQLVNQVNIAIMRAFVRLRGILLTHKDLAAKITALELKYKNHDIRLSEYDKRIAAIFEAISQLMAPPETPRRKIGYRQS